MSTTTNLMTAPVEAWAPCHRAHIHPLIRRLRRSFAGRAAKLNENCFQLLAAGIHLALCPKPRVELAPLEYTGFGADSPMRLWVLDRYVLRSRGSSISHEERAFCPWKREKLLLLCGIHCNLATFPFS